MLKKLVKYGNSHALILDRAIMELLNIREGAVLKLKTDGVSLTVTPTEKTTNVSLPGPTYYDMWQGCINNGLNTIHEALNDPQKAQLAKSLMPGGELNNRLVDETRVIMEKYRDATMKVMRSNVFKKESEALAIKFQDDPVGFQKAVVALYEKLDPTLSKMHKEMTELHKKLGMPEVLEKLNLPNSFTDSQK